MFDARSSPVPPPRIAVIGGGIAGLTAAYELTKRELGHISLYEGNSQLGGHAHTAVHEGIPFDTTVVAYHTEAYPHFAALVRELGLESETQVFRQDLCFHTEQGIRFAVSSRAGALLRHPLLGYRTIRALQHFSRALVVSHRSGGDDAESLGIFLRRIGSSEGTIKELILPMLHMFFGLDFSSLEAMPARYVVEHLYAHKVLHHSSLHSWRSWKRGTAAYVDALARRIREKGDVFTGVPIEKVLRTRDGRFALRAAGTAPEIFECIIWATPPATTLGLIQEPTPCEVTLLGPWAEGKLQRVIHRDARVLPKNERLRGFWNPYIERSSDRCAASYLMQKLQPRLSSDVVVSWAPIQKIDPRLILEQEGVTIGLYTQDSLKLRQRLPQLNEQGQSAYFCGAYFHYGWHESAVVSAKETVARVAADLASRALERHRLSKGSDR